MSVTRGVFIVLQDSASAGDRQVSQKRRYEDVKQNKKDSEIAEKLSKYNVSLQTQCP